MKFEMAIKKYYKGKKGPKISNSHEFELTEVWGKVEQFDEKRITKKKIHRLWS